MNFLRGFIEAKDKTYALKILIPYVLYYIMLYISSYSRFWYSNGFCFISMVGLYLTYVTGLFNLNTTAGMTFDWCFIEPFFYILFVLLDSNKLVDDRTVVWLYLIFTGRVMIQYLSFMTSTIR